MSKARNLRRARQRESRDYIQKLAVLCGNFYEFLSKQPQPSTEEVRAEFRSSNLKWIDYCKRHELINIDHLFVFNVREAWKRHTRPENVQVMN